jgi:predicted metalloprotease with PDZ domain
MRATAAAMAALLAGGVAYANLPPPEGDFTPGFTVIDADDRPVVETVVPGSPAAEAGIEPGYHVLAIAGIDALMMPIWSVTRNLYGFEGTTLSVIVSDLSGNVTVHELTRTVEQ